MRLSPITSKPIGIVVVYLLLGLLWITTSDQIAYLWFGKDTMQLTNAQLLKGVFFVLVTAMILYFLVNKLYFRLATYKDDLQSIYSNPDLAYLKLQKDGKLLQASESFYDLFQSDKHQVLKQNIFDLISDDQVTFKENLNEKLRSGTSSFQIQGEIALDKENGKWVDIYGAIKKNNPQYYLLSIHNISERKIIQKALDQELREKNALINNTGDFLFSVDKNLMLVSFNESFKKYYIEVNQEEPQKGSPIITENIPEKERKKWKNFYIKTLAGENLLTTEEVPTLNKEKIIIQINFYPIKENEEVVGVSVYARNVSELLITQKKLGETEAYLDVIANHANEVIIACDIDGKLVYANQTLKDWLDDPVPEKNLKDWPERYHLYFRDAPKLLAQNDMPIYQALINEKVQDYEFTIRRPEKPIVFLRASGSALWNTKGEKIGAMVIWSDITSQVDRDIHIYNATLEALEKEREEISSELHDSITQLLGVVNMNLKNLALDLPEIKNNMRFTKAQNELDNAIEETRNTAYRIMPKSIKDFGLVPALQELIRDISHNSDLQINFQYNDEKRLNNETELNVFRIAQEVMNNILQHSEAKQVDLKIEFLTSGIELKIEEDGIGFKPEDNNNGMGIRNMRNRAIKLKGELQIQEREQGGTKTLLRIPTNRKNE